MTRFLAILAALTCVASAQTYRTVTADTNNAIRTNFSLVRSQVSDLSGASFAISNVSGLQAALDAKIATNGSAAGLTNFPALLLTTNSAASVFPSALLRTNGDGSGLTNLPNANLSNAIGVLPIANGGTGATNASGARTALQLGSSATNDASAFQPANTNLTALAGGDGSSLTNVTITDASTLTNFPAELLRTNGDGSGLTGVASYPAFSNNAGKVLAVATNEAGVEWLPVSNTVTDASLLTNFPASLLLTNGNAAGLTNFPAELLRTNGSAAGLTSFPTLNQNTTGTASNVTGVVAISNGGSGQTTAAAAIEAFLPAYSGNANRILALNSNATALAWVTNAGGGSTVDLASTNATGILPLTKGGTGTNSASGAMTAFGVYAANNQVILGPSASDGTSGGFSPIQQVIVGAEAYSRSSYSVTVGYRATNLGANNTVINGRSTTNASDATAIGGRPFTSNAVVNAAGAVQIGIGTNSTASSIQFRTSGSVTETAWGYLANASAQGGYAMTNTSGISATNTIIGYDGTNYVTNTITVINGIITGWTQ